MDRNLLLTLRKQVVQSAQQLALNGAGTPESRFLVLLELIRSHDASKEVYDRAYELAKSQGDDDAKLSGLLDLLFEIDQAIGDEGQSVLASAEAPVPVPEAEQSQVSQSDNNQHD